MKKSLLTLSIALAGLLAAPAFAQGKGEADPDGAKAVPSKPMTKAEKLAAKKTRKAEGRQVAKSASTADDQPSTAAASGVPKAERQAARSKRLDAGAKATKEPKDKTGPNS